MIGRSAIAAAGVLLALAPPTPARAGWSIAYAPGTNQERLDAALLGRAERSIDMAAYVLTDMPTKASVSRPRAARASKRDAAPALAVAAVSGHA